MTEVRPPEEQASETAAPAVAEQDGGGFAVELPVFQGPLELLLHLIERQELDIIEVSLLAVTEQYMEQLNRGDRIELATLSSFISVGARLLLLKSRALLPRDSDADALDDDDRDPQALLAALEEYRRYRAAAEHLRDLEEEHRTAYRREAPPPQLAPGSGLDGVTTRTLFELFREVVERLPEEEEPEPELQRQPVRLEDRVSRLVQRLEPGEPVSFRELIGAATSRIVVIVDFLAVLELIRASYLQARQEGAFGEIELVRVEGATPPSTAQLAEDMPGL